MAGKIYTRSGDKGKTGLYDGTRVEKDDARIECIGTVDEANSIIGLLRSKLPLDHRWQAGLQRIQKELMDSMSHIATPSTSERKNQLPLPEGTDKWLEEWMDAIEAALTSPSEYFLLPGGNEIAALCHVIRTQLRRAERRLITVDRLDPLDPSILRFVNRLSDLFFKLAREEMDTAGIEEERWHLFRYKKIKG